MSTQTATIQIRINRSTKERAQNMFSKLGLDISSAIKMFLKQALRTRSIPFVARTVNGYTPEYEQMILREAEAMKNGSGKRFKTVAALMNDLNN